MIFRHLALIVFSLVLAGFSLTLYRLPLQILFPEFHDTYLVINNGKISAFLLSSWFLIGGYRASLIMLWDKNEGYHHSLSYRLKAIIFVPISMFYRFDISWYKLPKTDCLRSKN